MVVGAIKYLRRSKISSATDNNTDNNGELIAEARSNPAAFARLYRQHYDAVFRYCVHRLFERQIAEDITSDVFLKAVENFSRFEGAEQDFRNWLYTIATNAINSHLRKTVYRNRFLKLFHRQVDNCTVDGQSAVERPDDKSALLKKAMFELRPTYQTIITLRFFENLKLTEIAEVLDSSPGTVRSQLKRALGKLRKKIAFEQEV